jgi:hypothetical protein
MQWEDDAKTMQSSVTFFAQVGFLGRFSLFGGRALGRERKKNRRLPTTTHQNQKNTKHNKTSIKTIKTTTKTTALLRVRAPRG